MNWIEVEYSPGFSERLTSWKALINADGCVVQTVVRSIEHTEAETAHLAALIRARRESEIKGEELFSRQDYTCQLDERQMDTLRVAIGAVDFKLLAEGFAALGSICDIATVAIAVRSGDRIRGCSGPFGALAMLPDCVGVGGMSAEACENYRKAFTAFFDLWGKIGDVLPWKRQ